MSTTNPEETKSAKFIRLAEKRTGRILKNLKQLSYLSNRGNYEYTQQQLSEMFDAVDRELTAAKNVFIGTANQEQKPFTFTGETHDNN